MQRSQIMKGGAWFTIPILILLVFSSSSPVWAGESQPSPAEQVKPLFQEGPGPASPGLWAVPGDWVSQAPASLAPALPLSAPDDYGYTWDDTMPLSWVDATGGTDSGMSGASSGQHLDAEALGFSFKYYENTYSQVNIAAAGFLTFSPASSWPDQSQIPASGEPNNVIAPYWAPLYLSPVGPGGRVYTLRGGTFPNRYFVVEWFNVAGGAASDGTGGDDLFRFEVILHENGDILFQYDQMSYTGGRWCGSAGIEDAAGSDGHTSLAFCSAAVSDLAVRFSRPAPDARLRVLPDYQSGFIASGGTLSWPISLRNLGDMGMDTFDLTVDSPWTVSLLAGDGLTVLTDTDGDGQVDAGSLSQGSTRSITLQVEAPPGLPVGSQAAITLSAASSINPDIFKTVALQAAIPTRFAQVLRDDADGAMSLFLSQPDDWGRRAVSANSWWGYNPAVVETNTGGLFSIWEKRRFSDHGAVVSELEYTLVDLAGHTLLPVTRLNDYGSALQDTYDEEPVVAVAPDGKIGLAWRQRLIREAAGGTQEQWNIFLVILNPDGSLASDPTNLTQNSAWYQAEPLTFGVPRFWNVRLSASQDDDLLIAWQRESQEVPAGSCSGNCLLDDIYYTVRSTSGDLIKPVTRLTQDTPGAGEGSSSPAVARLQGAKWLLAYNHNPGGMAFVILDGLGNITRSRSFVGEGGWAPTAVQLISGRILLAWTAWTGSLPQVRVIVLDGTTFTRLAGPIVLTNPAAVTGGDFASLAQDALGNGVLTWMDYGWNDRHNLYYALLDGEGEVLTSPMIYLSAGTPASGEARIETGFSGYGNTSHRQFADVPFSYWAAGWIERLYDAGITNGCSGDPPEYCPETSVSRAQMAVLLGRALHGAAFTPPPPGGTLFADVPASHWAAAWIEQIHADQLTFGCAIDPLRFCPEGSLKRAEMAVFLVRAIHGPGFVPPAATGIFSDVPAEHWAAAWIEQLYQEGITNGCASAPLRFCPETSLTRAQTAVFLGRAFDIP